MNIKTPCSDGQSDLPTEVIATLKRVEGFLFENGLEALQRAFISSARNEDGIAYPRIPGGIGSTAPLNFIPNSGLPGICCRTVLAVAHGTRGKEGLGQVLRALRRHLIACAHPTAGLSTKTAVLVYDTERRSLFWDSRPDFEIHSQVNRVLFVKCFWDGRTLNVEN